MTLLIKHKGFTVDSSRVVGSPMKTKKRVSIYNYVTSDGTLKNKIMDIPANFNLGIVSSYIIRGEKIFWVFDLLDNPNIKKIYGYDTFYLAHDANTLSVNQEDLYPIKPKQLTLEERIIKYAKWGLFGYGVIQITKALITKNKS